MSFPCFVQKAGEFGQSAVYFLVFCPKKQVYLDNAPSLIGGFVQKEAEFGQTLFFFFYFVQKRGGFGQTPVFFSSFVQKETVFEQSRGLFPGFVQKAGGNCSLESVVLSFL